MKVAPDGTTTPAAPRTQTATALVKAMANAHRLQRMLEGGDYATVGELTSAEKVNPTYFSRVLRLTLLAPKIVEAILNGRQPTTLQLSILLEPFPLDWPEQRQVFRTL